VKIDKQREIYLARFDLTQILWHLTKPQYTDKGKMSSLQIIKNILNCRTIKGSPSGVASGIKVVSFMDIPLFFLPQVIKARNENDCNILPSLDKYGIGVLKKEVYLRGGRPVVYMSGTECNKVLDKDELWRYVKFDITDDENIIDWTHEREWRIKGDFNLDDLDNVFVLVKNIDEAKEILRQYKDNPPFSYVLPLELLEL